MTAPAGFTTGFAFSALAADERTKFIVNVCGHESVGMPLARSMDVVSEALIEANGIDNLIVPISVSTPKKGGANSKADFVVDVVVHPCLVSRCVPAHRLSEHMLAKLTQLALDWVLSECGVRLLGKSCTLLGVPLYVRAAPSVELNEVYKLAEQLLSQQRGVKSNNGTTADAKNGHGAAAEEEGNLSASGVRLPEKLTLATPSSTSAANDASRSYNKPLIQEVVEPRGGIKKGFLVDSKATPLYGPQGTSEGSGKTPDPLAHIPQSLREKCTIIDTRNMTTTGPRNVPDGAASSASQLEGTPMATTCAHKTQGTSNTSNAPAADKEEEVEAKTPSWQLMEMAVTQESITVRLRPSKPVHSMREVDLSVTENTVEVDGSTIVQLPKSVDTDGVKARFVKATNTLTVICPRVK